MQSYEHNIGNKYVRLCSPLKAKNRCKNVIKQCADQGRIQEFVHGGGLKFFSLPRRVGLSARWGLKTP